MKIIFLLGVVLITSCNSLNVELEKLRIENQALTSELKELRDEINGLDFSVVVIPERYSIKKGEEFKAIAVLAIEETSVPVSAQILNIQNPSDALFQDESAMIESKSQGQILITSNQEMPGTYNIAGELKLEFLGREFERLFSIDSEVKD
jgi:hypothetical protein